MILTLIDLNTAKEKRKAEKKKAPNAQQSACLLLCSYDMDLVQLQKEMAHGKQRGGGRCLMIRIDDTNLILKSKNFNISHFFRERSKIQSHFFLNQDLNVDFHRLSEKSCISKT